MYGRSQILARSLGGSYLAAFHNVFFHVLFFSFYL